MTKLICLILTFILLLCCGACGEGCWDTYAEITDEYEEYEKIEPIGDSDYFMCQGQKYYFASKAVPDVFLAASMDVTIVAKRRAYAYLPVDVLDMDENKDFLFFNYHLFAIKEGVEIPDIRTLAIKSVFIIDYWASSNELASVDVLDFSGTTIGLMELLGDKIERESVFSYDDDNRESFDLHLIFVGYEELLFSKIHFYRVENEYFFSVLINDEKLEELNGYYEIKEEYLQAFIDAANEYKRIEG